MSMIIPYGASASSIKSSTLKAISKAHKAKIPSTSEELLRIGLGTYKTFDVGPNESLKKNLSQVLQTFIDGGGQLIDSSPMYGTSESVVGELSQELNLNDRLFMATKVWTSGKDAGLRQMQESFEKMKRTKMDLMQIHNLVDWKTHLPTLKKWKEQGKIRYYGVTHYSTSAFANLEQVLKEEKMDFLQIPYSIVEMTGEKSLIPLAAEKGVAVIANEPFDHGALFRAVQEKSVPEWAKKELEIETWAQYFLKFILGNPNVQFAIPGTGKVTHMKDNLKAAYGELPNPKQRKKMIREFSSLS